MKISGIKFHNHPVLGDLHLSFKKADGTNYDNIILIGENGTGKSTIIEGLANFLDENGFSGLEYIQYEVDGTEMKAVPDENSGFYHIEYFDGTPNKQMHTNKHFHNSNVDQDTQNIRFYGCFLSKARANFVSNQIKSTTALSLDSSKHSVDEGNDFTSLKQLIVDLANQDNESYAEINRARLTNPMSMQDFETQSRLHRFSNAFNSFFDHLQFNQVKTINGQKEIEFKKYDMSIPVDKLSTGEKQIVYRGGSLLRNQNNAKGGIIVIDEPELSMHPSWQAKILKYYKDLFIEPDGSQSSQIFMASHSENVLKAALADIESNLVIMLRDNGGTIEAHPVRGPFVLPTITFGEINYEAFNMVSTDYHIALFSQVQQIGGSTMNIKDTDSYISSHVSYVTAQHEKPSAGIGTTTYLTLSTYIRNAIDHPDNGNTYTEEELRTSIELLREIIQHP